MKTIVISDLHLTDQFHEDKFLFLQQLINSADRVIINGDLYSDFAVTFDAFCRSEWQQLFPLLKAKKTIYIYGNHDEKTIADERVKLFSVKDVEHHTLKTKTKTLHIEHGHHLLSKRWKQPELVVRATRKAQLGKVLDSPSVRLVNRYGGRTYTLIGAVWQRKLKKYANDQEPAIDYLVVGHTHIPEYSEEGRFINDGFIDYHFASWLEVTDGENKLRLTRY